MRNEAFPVRVKVCMCFIFHRANCRKAGNSPDAGMLKKLVRDRNCRPVLRGILETLLHYLTQVLPKRTTNNKPTEKTELEAAVQHDMRRPGQRTVVSKQQTQPRGEPAIVHFSQKNRLPDSRARDCTPRRLTTFQILQSKFMRANPQTPITHQREVGMLNCFRGMSDLKRGQGSNSSVCKSQTRREHGPKKAASVKDIVAKFALAEQKETGESLVKKQLIPPRLISRGNVISSLMAKFEHMVTQHRGSDFRCSDEDPSQEVKVTNKKGTGVDYQKRQRQQIVAKLGTQEKETQVKSESTEVWIEGASIKRHQERPKHVNETTTKINTDQEENQILAENYFKHKAESQSSSQTTRAQSSERWTTEIGIIKQLNYEHEEQIRSECVIENLPPEPCRAVTQLEGPMDVHVATIMTCSPLWSKSVYSFSKLLSAETSGGLCKDHSDGVNPKKYTVGKIEAEDTNCAKNKSFPRHLPKFLIPRVQRISPQNDSLHQSEPHFGNSSSHVTGTISHIMEKDQTELIPQHKEEIAKEQQPIIRNRTGIPQSIRVCDRMENKAIFEDQNTADASPPKMNPDRNIQRWRPKYTTINYGDPSVKHTYKPKTIRFTDTFTF